MIVIYLSRMNYRYVLHICDGLLLVTENSSSCKKA